MGSSGMDQDSSHLGPDHAYAGNHWVDSYSTMVIPEYAGNFYMHAVTHGLPSETHGLPSEAVGAGHMPPPPVPHQQLPSMPHHHPNQHSHQQHPPPPQHQPMHFPSQLHPSPVMQAQKVNWPSLHTNPGQQQQQQKHYSAPPVAIPPQSAPAARQTPKQLPSITTSQPRRTLSDEDRRLMCQFQIDNPKSKQTEIGLKFGVERR